MGQIVREISLDRVGTKLADSSTRATWPVALEVFKSILERAADFSFLRS